MEIYFEFLQRENLHTGYNYTSEQQNQQFFYYSNHIGSTVYQLQYLVGNNLNLLPLCGRG